MRRQSFLALLLGLCALSAAAADDGLTRFHYSDLYKLQQSVSSLQDLKSLSVHLYVTSTLRGVTPQDITLTLQHASGSQEPIPHDVYGRILLPASDALKAEDPLVLTNQPKHTLNASVVIDLTPPAGTELRYDALMLGVLQLNEAIQRERLGAMAKLYGEKCGGLLIFYGGGGHSLTLHRKAGDEILKSTSVEEVLSHLKGLNKDLIPPGTQIIYVPLDAAALKENPRVTLDAPTAQVFPAF